MTSSSNDVCPSCGVPAMQTFHRQHRVPSHSCLLVDSDEEALAFPTGALRLAACHRCGFVANLDNDVSLQAYSTSYEETQGFSPRFRTFAADLASRLVDQHGLRDADIVEIGCGKGEFLSLLCELGANRGVGIDPSFVPERFDRPARGEVRFLQELYAEEHTELPADAIVCRHTLEHIPDTAEFMALVHRAATRRPGTLVVFELPDVLRVLREVAFWDVYYEHCSYFSAGSLARLFRLWGFEVLDLTLEFDDQYVVIVARASDGSPQDPLPLEEPLDELLAAVRSYADAVGATTAQWRERLSTLRAQGRRAVLWGGGSKAVSFLTTLGLHDEIAEVVDINPYKHGKFVAGAGHRVVAPEQLLERPPDLVIAMNAVYLDEIREALERLGLHPALEAV